MEDRNIAVIAADGPPMRKAKTPEGRGKPSPAFWLKPGQAQSIGARITMRIAELGSTREQVAKRAKISNIHLYRLLAGTEYNPTIATLRGICDALGKPLAWIIEDDNYIDLGKATIPLVGQAEVGVFRTDKPPQSGTIADVAPIDQRFIHNPRFGVVVADGSLDGLVNAVGAARVIGLVIADRGLEHGRIYLIHRVNRDGQTETTFRRAAVYHDRYEFETLFADAAKNARHLLVVPGKDLASNQVEIGGLFYAATCQYL